MNKIGRNDPCHCGSGKKYKKCCSDKSNPAPFDRTLSASDLKFEIEKMQARQKQIEKQQGLGRSIISIEFNGYRFVAVGSGFYRNDLKKWRTVHSFLIDYLKITLGENWGNEELKKPFQEMHQIIQWYKLASNYMNEQTQAGHEIQSAPMTGSVFALLSLAYNLYLLEHNVAIQKRLIGRLKDKNNFQGALYETYVSAIFIRAGFKLTMENEDDGEMSHCEFTAVASFSNEKYSVEAKARQPYREDIKIGRRLGRALKKATVFKRVVFIDMNIKNLISEMPKIIEELKQKEITLEINDSPAPPAYVFVTNHSFAYDLEGFNYERIGFAQGFKIDDFKVDSKYTSLREARLTREKHKDMEGLIKSIREHDEIPVTFDGEIPEFAFSKEVKKQRLLIGQKYLVPDKDGKEVIGTLTSATIIEQEKKAYCAYQLENGKNIICTVPVTDEEIQAYKRYPDTFFGVPRQQGRKTENPLELYDFFYESYKKSPREKLLEFMKDRSDIEELKKLNDEELLVTCCEGWVYSILNDERKKELVPGN